MGLDMYLRARRYVSGYARINSDEEQNEWERLLALYPSMEELVPEHSPSAYVEFTIGYWRKSNHVHQWFVDHVQGGEDECKPHYVGDEKLRQLREACLRVLAFPEEAEDELPTQGGFFFGSTEHGDWYFADLRHTVEVIDKAMALPDWSIIYQSSW